MKGLYVILDHTALAGRDPLNVPTSIIRGGANVIQYRAKGLGDGEFFHHSQRLSRLCKRKGVAFIVNDRVDIAKSVNADGVHLGGDDLPPNIAQKLLGPGKIIGVSSHSVREAWQRARGGPSYVAFGPVFRSRTKRTRRRLLGLSSLKKAARRMRRPLVAVGGIDQKTAGQAIASAASAVAVVHAVLGSQNPGNVVRSLARIIRQGKSELSNMKIT